MQNLIFNKQNSHIDLSSIKNLTILYLNDDLSLNNVDLNLLKELFTNIICENKVDDVLKLIEENDPHVVIFDLKINGKNGLDLAKIVKENNPFQPVIIKTAKYKKKDVLKAFDIHVDSFLISPVTEENFIKKILFVGEKYFLKKRNIRKRKILQSILDNQSGLILLTDFETVSFCSKSFLDFFNFNHPDDIFYRYESILNIFIKHENYMHANSKKEFLQKFKNARAIDKVVLVVGKDFVPKAFHINIDLVEIFEEPLYIVSLTNISIIQEKNIEISNKVYFDGLTGVYNRLKFEETFEYEQKKAKRYENNLCVAVLDIDHFKRFNDTYGHLIGDEVLITMAKKIDANTRETDLFARWGGEEFILLMPEATLDEAKVICEKLRRIVEEIEHPTAGKITCSFGISKLNDKDITLNSVFKRCDIALYNAKANGRNIVMIEE